MLTLLNHWHTDIILAFTVCVRLIFEVLAFLMILVGLMIFQELALKLRFTIIAFYRGFSGLECICVFSRTVLCFTYFFAQFILKGERWKVKRYFAVSKYCKKLRHFSSDKYTDSSFSFSKQQRHLHANTGLCKVRYLQTQFYLGSERLHEEPHTLIRV